MINNIDNLNNNDGNVYSGGIKQKFLGEGSYGCTFYPGITCLGKNQTKDVITKIQEINYVSKNEVKISELIKNKVLKNPHAHNRFIYISKSCIVNYNILQESSVELDKCKQSLNIKNSNSYDNLFNFNSDVNSNNYYYLFSMQYIKGTTLYDYFKTKYEEVLKEHAKEDLKEYVKEDIKHHVKHYAKENANVVFKNIISIMIYLLQSINILNNNNISHNDLHYKNILIKDNKNNKKTNDKEIKMNLTINKKKHLIKLNSLPYIIDFGISFVFKKIINFNRTHDKIIDMRYLKQYCLSYNQERFFERCLEYNFVSFIINNNTPQFYNKLDKSNVNNVLTQNNIKDFIHDYRMSIKKYKFDILFQSNEIDIYLNSVEKYFKKFVDYQEYPTYHDILIEILPNLFLKNDLYLLIFNFIEFFINYNNINYTFIVNIINKLFKKIMIPDPDYSLTAYQFLKIFNYFIYFISNINISKDMEDDKLHSHIIYQFNQDFDFLLTKILKINTNNFYNDGYILKYSQDSKVEASNFFNLNNINSQNVITLKNLKIFS